MSLPNYATEQEMNINNINRVYRQVESRLETIVERLLRSRMNDKENVLDSMQGMIERIFITSAMRIAGNNITQAARLLGINRNTLSKKLKEMREEV